MCGIAGIIGKNCQLGELESMIERQRHRGPDGQGIYVDPQRMAALGHARLSIIDLTDGGRQPMSCDDGRLTIVLNGEIYNYIELRQELENGYAFKTRSDTEVLLAAYQKWGRGCLDRLIGMFAFAVWDAGEKSLFAARDRFGVKPFYFHQKPDGTLLFASEIKALHAAGAERESDLTAWATYLSFGLYDHTDRTFWKNINSLPPGHTLVLKDHHVTVSRWYDLAEAVGDADDARNEQEAADEYFELMKQSVKLRFRSDVPVGINLSGGLDSSTLLGLVHAVQGADSDVKAFTFVTGDEAYDELPWVASMLASTNHKLIVSKLAPADVPELAASVQVHQDEPFGGLPTLAYAKLFERAKAEGVTVLLDGNGMDEQWAGYDYYQTAIDGRTARADVIQGVKSRPVRPECLAHDFRALAEPFAVPSVGPDTLRNLQYRDTRHTKIPRAMRFNDRISMRASTELREPFLDHRMFELAFRQPASRKIGGGVGKKMLRQIAARFIPADVSHSPKRPLQTPQREWLAGELKDWADAQIRAAFDGPIGACLDRRGVLDEWQSYCSQKADNSFFVWQWISIGLMSGERAPVGAGSAEATTAAFVS